MFKPIRIPGRFLQSNKIPEENNATKINTPALAFIGGTSIHNG
jgi:hypothetical protein